MGWRSKDESARPAREVIENVLGRSAFIRGELSAEGAFRIDGTIEGTVASRSEVVVGETGVVKGDVVGSDVVVAGQILGNVRCTGHLEILAKGKVEGDITAKSVRIETGGVFRGTSFMGTSGSGASASGSDKSKLLDADDEAEIDAATGHLVPAA
jgi:cytoskeletal protein CcmA (bactofilin family)